MRAQEPLIDSLQQIVDLQKHDTTELHALLNLAFVYSRTDLQKVKQLSQQVLRYSTTPDRVRWRTGAFNYLVPYYHQTGQLDSARYYLSQSEQLAMAYPSNIKINYNFNQMAGLFYKETGDLKKALPYMEKNLELWKIEDEYRAGQLLNLGNLYVKLGDFRQAVEYHLKALTIFEKTNSLRGQSFALQGIGTDFLSLKQYDKSREYYERSYAVKEAQKDSRGLLSALRGLADVNKETGNFRAAEQQYREALKLARKQDLALEAGRIHHQLGLLYKKAKRPMDARKQFDEALKAAQMATDSVMVAQIQSELIGLDSLEQKVLENESVLQNSLRTSIRSGDRRQQAIEYNHLGDYYALNQKFDKAYYYLVKHHQLSDSLQSNDIILQMKDLEEQYEGEKKEREIAILKKEQEVQALTLSRQRANNLSITLTLISVIVFGTLLINRYRMLNRAKRHIEIENVRNNIARDLHDDIGSTLSSISIMSRIALQQSGNSSSYLQKIAGEASHIMESMSDIVWSINPKNDSLEQVMVKMKEFAAEILEPKDMVYTFEVAPEILDIKLDVEKRKNIFLVFKEAINNAAKYSHGKNVQVTLARAGASFVLKINDDGKGFSINTTHTGNGLKNMEARAHAVGGILEKETTPGSGTCITLRVSIT